MENNLDSLPGLDKAAILFQVLGESLSLSMFQGISEGRIWTKEKTRAVIDKGPYMILSKAKSAGLIDSIMFTDQFEKYVKIA